MFAGVPSVPRDFLRNILRNSPIRLGLGSCVSAEAGRGTSRPGSPLAAGAGIGAGCTKGAEAEFGAGTSWSAGRGKGAGVPTAVFFASAAGPKLARGGSMVSARQAAATNNSAVFIASFHTGICRWALSHQELRHNGPARSVFPPFQRVVHESGKSVERMGFAERIREVFCA